MAPTWIKFSEASFEAVILPALLELASCLLVEALDALRVLLPICWQQINVPKKYLIILG